MMMTAIFMVIIKRLRIRWHARLPSRENAEVF
jgi:hypothetical protein